MTGLQGALIGLGFGAAVFIIALGIGGAAAWWTERKGRPRTRTRGVLPSSNDQPKELK